MARFVSCFKFSSEENILKCKKEDGTVQHSKLVRVPAMAATQVCTLLCTVIAQKMPANLIHCCHQDSLLGPVQIWAAKLFAFDEWHVTCFITEAEYDSKEAQKACLFILDAFVNQTDDLEHLFYSFARDMFARVNEKVPERMQLPLVYKNQIFLEDYLTSFDDLEEISVVLFGQGSKFVEWYYGHVGRLQQDESMCNLL